MIPAVCVIGGKSNSGKTTLMEKLIKEVKSRGYRVATVKHRHKDFEIDIPGKDSWRHSQAGSDLTIISSPTKLAMVEKTEKEYSLDEILNMITGVDLILVEGYKRSDKPKIEVFRSDFNDDLFCKPEELLAIASDVDFNGVPCYSLDDASGIIDAVLGHFGITNKRA